MLQVRDQFFQHLPSTNPACSHGRPLPPGSPGGVGGPLAPGKSLLRYTSAPPGSKPQTHLPLPNLFFAPPPRDRLPPALFVLETPIVWEGSVWGGEGFPFSTQGCG